MLGMPIVSCPRLPTTSILPILPSFGAAFSRRFSIRRPEECQISEEREKAKDESTDRKPEKGEPGEQDVNERIVDRDLIEHHPGRHIAEEQQTVETGG